MMTSGTKAKIALVGLLAVTAAGCGGDDSGSPAAGPTGGATGDKSYKVGVILPLTGPAAAIGTDFKTGLEVFRDIDADAQGLEIEYVVCDDKSTPDGAAACARQVVQQDKVNMVSGPVISGTHAGARPVLLT